MDVALIIGLATLVQLVAAFLALRLIRITGVRTAWVLISVALCLMALRRAVTLWRLSTGNPPEYPNLADESVALAISLVMLAGVSWIPPLFQTIKSSEEALRKSKDELEARVAERTSALAEANLKMQGEVEERRRAEAALEAEHQRLFSLLDGLPALVYLKAPDYSIRFANRTFREVFGDAAGKCCSEAVYGFQQPCEDCPQKSIWDDKLPRTYEWTSPDGARTYHLYNYPFSDIDGSPLILTLGLDISQRKHAEEELRQSEALLAEAQRIARLGYWDLDLTSNRIVWSEEMYRIFNLEPKEFSPTFDAVLERFHPAEREVVQKGVEEAITHGTPFIMENRILWPDGSERFVQAGGEVTLDGSGRPVRLIGTSRDVTERRRGEMALKQSEENLRYLASKLLTAQETERRRLSRELHDSLGQSLLVLKLQMKNIQRKLGEACVDATGELFQEMVAYLGKVIDSARRLSRDLTPSILEDLGLSAALKSLINTFSKHHHSCQVSVDLDAEIDPLFTPESRINIFRIFQESLTNIGKYAHATRIKLNIKRKGEQVCFLIEDDGSGFDVAQVLAIKGGDKGLGLAAMEERVRMLGGTLQLMSEEGKGTRIAFTVPLPNQSSFISA